MVVGRLFPQISLHGPEVPTSVWNLPFYVWRGITEEIDALKQPPVKRTR